tara:strand:+ start:175 stop:519 length:345 start_codon:yes stop_codon:yes gene_type:complete
MKQFWKEILTDESGKYSGARAQSMILLLTGVLAVVVGFVMLAVGVTGVTGFVAMVIGGAWGKSASDIWAAQLKSAQVKVATTTTVSTGPSQPSPLPSPPPSTTNPATKPPGGTQ